MTDNNFDRQLGQRIRKLRENNFKPHSLKTETQPELQKAMGLSHAQTIQQWEDGSRQVKAQYIVALAKHYGVSTDYLLGLTGVKKADTNLRASAEYLGLDETPATLLKDCKDLNKDEIRKCINALLSADEFYYAMVYLQMVSIIEQSKTDEERDNPSVFDERCEIIDNLTDKSLLNGTYTNNDRISRKRMQSLYTQMAKDIMCKAIDKVAMNFKGV